MTFSNLIAENISLIEAIAFSCFAVVTPRFASDPMLAEKKWSQLVFHACGPFITISVIISGFFAGSLPAMLIGLIASLFTVWKLVNHLKEQSTTISEPALD
ncbi:MAG: hypothetical protein ACK5ZD_05870 [Hyphomonadaceae bacterium]|jgi:uncharacterized membrane protein